MRYFDESQNEILADCTAATSSPTLRFNEGRLRKEFFSPPYGTKEQYELVIHEFGHALDQSGATDHGLAWAEAAISAGALILRESGVEGDMLGT